MRTRSSLRALLALMVVVVVGALVLPAGALAGKTQPPSSVIWSGNGTHLEGSSRVVDTDICAANNNTPYLLFVLSSTKALSNTYIKFGDARVLMTKSNADKKGTSSYKAAYTPGSPIDLATLLALPVKATYTGDATPTLTVSHGCTGASNADVLTVHLLGDASWNGSVYAWANLGSPNSNNATVKACEAGSATNCVTFATGATPGSTGTITLNGAGKALDITTTDDYTCQYTDLALSTTTAGDVFAYPQLNLAEVNGGQTWTTTTTFSNGDDAWLASYCTN